MASANVIGSLDRDSVLSSELRWATGGLILGAISFNAFLCFLNTRGVAISNVHVMLSEMLLISAALFACRNSLNFVHIAILTLVIVYTVALAGLRFADVPAGGLDLKISRDFIIPIVFFLLGRAVGDLRVADAVVFTATAIVLFFALFEYFFLDAYLAVFGVAEYYIARGTVEVANSALSISEGLMTSGFRPSDQGRALLPFLGDHRVSSVFLEPITLGNFGALVALWALVRSRMEGRFYVWLALAGLALIVLSDGRFVACFVIVSFAVVMAPPRTTTLGAFLLPFAIILTLCAWGAAVEQSYSGAPEIVEGLGAYDRLLYSARVLFDFDILNWMGLEASRAQTFDTGYGYVISNIGIVGLVALWLLFMSREGPSHGYFAFRNAIAVFLAVILCISNSPFTIKIAAPLWFLLGVLSVAGGCGRMGAPAQDLRAVA
jgi:putative polymerase